MTPSKLPAPLSSLQAALATDATHLARVFAVIAKAIDCKLPEVNYTPFVEAIERFVETSQQIQSIPEKSPIADEAGLNAHEFAALAAIADKVELPTSTVWPYAITSAMNEAGYRNIAATFGMPDFNGRD